MVLTLKVPGQPRNRQGGLTMPLTNHDKAISRLIGAGADKALVSAVMQRESRCVNATLRGVAVRVILRDGTATNIMADRSAVKAVDDVLAAIGSARCEVRWLGA